MNSLDELREETKILADNHIDTDELVRIADAIEREVLERYIEAPTDKDGELVRVCHVLQDERLGGGWCEPFEVHHLRIGLEGWEAYDEYGCGHIVRLCRHKPPTVEDVLEKALNKAASLDRPEGYWPSAADITNILNEIAPKLQLREED